MPNKHGSKWCRPITRLAIYLRDRFHCVYCGRDLHAAPAREVTLDHVVPRSAGGTNDATNLVTACKRCNDAKGDTPWRTYVRQVHAGSVFSAIGHFPASHVAKITNARRRKLNRSLARSVLNGCAPRTVTRITRGALAQADEIK